MEFTIPVYIGTCYMVNLDMLRHQLSTHGETTIDKTLSIFTWQLVSISLHAVNVCSKCKFPNGLISLFLKYDFDRYDFVHRFTIVLDVQDSLIYSRFHQSQIIGLIWYYYMKMLVLFLKHLSVGLTISNINQYTFH